MDDKDQSYYRERAEIELETARQAINPLAGKAHFLLAGLYFDRAFRADNQDATRMEVGPGFGQGTDSR